MTLRLRIILIVAAGLLLTSLALLGSGWIAQQLQQERIAQLAQQAQSSLWEQILAAEEQDMDAGLDKLAAMPAFVKAAKALDSNTLDGKALEKALIAQNLYPGEDQQIQLIAVLRPGREPFSLGRAAPQPLLDNSSLEQLFSGEVINGLRLGSGNIAMVISARLLPVDGEPVAIVAGRHIGGALHRLGQRGGLRASLIDLRGSLIATSNADLWQQIEPRIAPRQSQYFEADIGQRIHTVTSHQVRDLAQHDVGSLVTIKDQTEQSQASRFLNRLTAGVALALIACGLLGLSWYLRHSFKPLEQAIAALQALATGNTDVQLHHARNDEIGRIAKAVTSFRSSARELARTRSLHDRVRRRQEQLIHQQLQQLADATDMTSREEVLQLLQSGSEAQSAGPGEDNQLRQLALVMSDLTRRIVDQHQRLSSMVVELREALVTKTRLAGLQQELQIAAEVQRSILPQQMPEDPRLQMHCHITPAREVGGDFYDYFMLDDEHLGVVVADVSGKGIPAALFMAITRTLLKSTAAFVTAPSPCIRRLNDLLAAENEQMMFVTVFYGVLHLPSGQLRYVNAGHNPPYLLSASNQVQTLARTGGVAVAVSEEFPYQEAVLQLHPGDRLFLFTDGVTEAFNAEQQEYGDKRLVSTLQSAAAHCQQPEELNRVVLQSVRDFEDGAPQADDITCVSLRYCGP